MIAAYQPELAPLGSLALSALVACLPLLTIFITLGALRWKAHIAGLTALAVALLVAILVYKMPALLALNSAVEGGVFHDPRGDDALFSAIDGHLGRHVRLEEIDVPINDPAFAARAVELLNGLMEG